MLLSKLSLIVQLMLRPIGTKFIICGKQVSRFQYIAWWLEALYV